MSGHSKWSKIKHKKGAADAKKGAIFTKLGKAITVAARSGDKNPDMNFSLRLAIDKAKQANMPKDNIEKAIERAAGPGGDVVMEKIIYEGFGPGQVAFLIDVLTDNKNRAASEIKHIFSKNGGSLGGPGSVAWMFDLKGVIRINKNENNIPSEELELRLIDAGADDIENKDEEMMAYFRTDSFEEKRKKIEEDGIIIDSSGIEYIAKENMEIDEEKMQKIENLCDELDENQDVNEYFTNLV